MTEVDRGSDEHEAGRDHQGTERAVESEPEPDEADPRDELDGGHQHLVAAQRHEPL